MKPRASLKPKPAVKVPVHRAALKHEVRLIGGQYRGRKLPVADRPGMRPTPDRVRETLFNWLGQDLAGWRVLDAFAGSGALGFEAASRGAAAVQLLERDSVLVANLLASRQRLAAQAVRIERTEALRWMAASAAQCWELVLVDPPFDAGLGPAAVAQAARLLVPGGYLYCEGPAFMVELPRNLVEHRRLRAGAVHVQLLVEQALDGQVPVDQALAALPLVEQPPGTP